MLIKHLRYIKEYFIIKWSGLFDADYYLQQYPSVEENKVNPLFHFIKMGWKEGKNPSADFNTAFYLDLNQDVEDANLNPLYHFIKHGRKEQRCPEAYDTEKVKLTRIDITTKQKQSETLEQNAHNPPDTVDILIFPIIDWFFRFQRPQQLASHLADAGHRIFYIRTSFCKGSQPRIKRLEKNIYLVQLSNGDSSTLFNTYLTDEDISVMESSLQLLRDIFLINSATMLVDLPFWAGLTTCLQSKFGWKLVYDCMDLHLGFSNHSYQAKLDEENLINNSDLVIATSQYLLDHISKQSSNCIVVSNGTDFEFFHQAKDPIPCEQLDEIPKPIIGYYGAIADWFDTNLISLLARDHPEWAFVLIGDTHLSDLKPLEGLNNIFLLGEKPYTEIPKYLSHFDVCLIPFRQSNLTHATNPVKMYEYLSAGKPIVATRLNELSLFSDYICLAETKQEWLNAIHSKLLEEKTPELLEKRFSFAKANSWKEKAQLIRSEVLDFVF